MTIQTNIRRSGSHPIPSCPFKLADLNFALGYAFLESQPTPIQKAIIHNALRTTVENLATWLPRVMVEEMRKSSEEEAKRNIWRLK